MNKYEIKNLDLYYGQFKALKNINLSICEKEIMSFIGPSGCGKSTLLKTLNRMNDLVENCRIEGKILLDAKGEVCGFEELKGIKTHWSSGWRESESLKMLT